MSENKEPFYQILARDATSVEVLFYGYIGPSEQINDQAFALEWKALESKYKKVTLRVNSGGGSVFSGIAIYNLIKQSTLEVTVKIDGLAGSMASVVILAVPLERREMASNGRIMIHKPSGGGYGSSQQLRQVADTLDSLEETMADIYQEATGKEASEVAQWMQEGIDRYFTGKQALQAGLIGKIIGTSSLKPPAAQLTEEAALYQHFQMQVRGASPRQWSLKDWVEQDPEGLCRMIREEPAWYGQLFAAHSASRARQPIENSISPTLQPTITMSTNEKTNWNFDKWRKEDPKGCEKMRLEDPQRYEQLKRDYIKGREVMKADWDFNQWHKQDPRGMEKMQRDEPERYERLKAAYVAKLRNRNR